MAGRKTTRLQVTVPEELVRNIDNVCEVSGMTRSAWVEYTLGSAIASYKQLIDKTAQGFTELAAAKQE